MTDATLGSTPSQTVGPFFHLGLPWPDGPFVVAEDHPDALVIEGTLYDGAGDGVPDGLIETWQADPDGRFPHPDDPRGAREAGGANGFRGFGRCPTDAEGRFRIVTVKPGAVPGPSGPQAPHIDVTVFARGLLKHLITRIYFADEAEANATDPVLSSIEDEAARSSLVARPEGAGGGYRFDIHLQGERETVFFDL